MSSEIAEISAHSAAGNSSSLYRSLSQEILGAVTAYRLWLYLAWSDIRQRYRGSVLGPFWITLSTAIFVSALSVINAELFKAPQDTYIPLLSSGFVIWYFISGTLSESTSGLVASKGLISQISLPFYVHLLRVVVRNLLIFSHNMVVVIFVLFWFKINPFPQILWLIPGMILVLLILLSGGMILAMIGARYRDIQQVVASLLQVLFFISPITWEAKHITKSAWVLYCNPIYYIIDAMRAPLLGLRSDQRTLPILCLICVLTCSVATWLFNRKRDRIPYWVQ